MSAEAREELVDRLIASQPNLKAFVRRHPLDLTAGSWDMLSYSFQRGFDVMWDNARTDHSGLLLRPLLVLWRQSVELAIKAAVIAIAGEATPKASHNLSKLFEQLIQVRAEIGLDDENEYTDQVRAMIAHVQFFDPLADRFRYPASRDGTPFEGIEVNTDDLYQAHFAITTWCEGAVLEVEQSRSFD